MSFNDYWQGQQQRRAVAEAVAALRAGDAPSEARLYQALQKAVLLLPVPELPDGMTSGDLLVGQNVQVKVTMVQGVNQQLFLPLFTSEEYLQRVHPAESPYILVAFPPILEMVQGAQVAGIVIDRGGPATAMVPLTVLQSFGRGQPQRQPSPPVTLPPQPLRVGPMPRVVSQHEIATVGRWLQAQPGLVQAYLFGLSQAEPQARPMLTVGLGFPQVPAQSRIEQMAREVGTILGPSGVIVLDGRLAALLAQQVGVIRFDLVAEPEDNRPGSTPPSADFPSPA